MLSKVLLKLQKVAYRRVSGLQFLDDEIKWITVRRDVSSLSVCNYSDVLSNSVIECIFGLNLKWVGASLGLPCEDNKTEMTIRHVFKTVEILKIIKGLALWHFHALSMEGENLLAWVLTITWTIDRDDALLICSHVTDKFRLMCSVENG